MTLREKVQKQVTFMGRTPGGCRLVLHDLLDNGRDVFQFMQLFTEDEVEVFYYIHAKEIDTLCTEDEVEGLAAETTIHGDTKLALEKILMLIEGDMKKS